MKKYDYIIVGSGLCGTVMAERLERARKSVLIIEKRNHIGGNCYSYQYPGTNIEVHKYGTHIFHTCSNDVWRYVNRFVEFNRYRHRVLTICQGKVYSMPINLATINSFYNANYSPAEAINFIASKRQYMKHATNLEQKALTLIGKDLYEAFIKGYTIKQWGCNPTHIPASTLTRLPVRYSYNDCYFNDYYQGLPVEGYTTLFKKMLHGVPLEVKTDFFDDREKWMKRCHTLIYTGPIDRYFEYACGRLKWRSLKFEIQQMNVYDYQGTSVMNYADIDTPYTRIHEPKHLHLEKKQDRKSTVIIREYPHLNDKEPYYPVNSPEDKKMYSQYRVLASKEKRVIFAGRLAEYKYYDMNEVIEKCLNTKLSVQ